MSTGARRVIRRLYEAEEEQLLLVTPEQLEIARDNKHQVVAVIPISTFHTITTQGEEQVGWKFDEARDLQDYNRWSAEGKITQIPFMRIQIRGDGTDYIDGHEGRTRAAALAKAGRRYMPVAIQLRYDYDNPPADRKYDRELVWADVPDTIEAQFREGVVTGKDEIIPVLDGNDEVDGSNADEVMRAQAEFAG